MDQKRYESEGPSGGTSPFVKAGLIAGGLALAALFLFAGVGHWFSWGSKTDFRDLPPRLVAQRGPLTVEEQATIEAFRTASPCVVFITSKHVSRGLFRLSALDVSEDAGSGFVWDANGYIVTNYHVVENSEEAEVTLSDQSTWKAHRVGTEPDKDIAVLKIDAPNDVLPPLRLGSSRDLQVGQRVYALGNPFGYDQTMTAGIISGLGREIQSVTHRQIRGVIQTDAPLNPGNSGGPLLDSAGRVIGMTTAILSPTGAYAGIGFAIPIDTIRRIVPEIVRGESAAKPRLGVIPAQDHLVRRMGLTGVLVLEVLPNTAAEKAGLQATKRKDNGRIALGDLIVAVDGQPVQTSEDLFRIIDGHAVGDRVKLTVQREGKSIEVDVTLESMP